MSHPDEESDNFKAPSWSTFFTDRPQDKLSVFDWSVSGFETCVVVHGQGFRLALDIGACPFQAVSADIVFVSHGHVDHCGALHQHMRRRQLVGLPPATYYVPEHLVQPLTDIVRLFDVVHGDADDGDSEGVDSGSRAAKTKTAKDKGHKKAKGAKGQTGSATGNKAEDQTGSEAKEQTGSATGSEAKKQTGSATGSEAKEQTGSATGSEAKEHTGNATGNEAEGETGSATRKKAKDQLGSATGSEGKFKTETAASFYGTIVAAKPGEDIQLSKNLRLRAFATDHRVPSIGCILYSRRSHLLPEFAGLPGPDLAELARNGTQLRESRWEPTIGYTGDTRFSVFACPPEQDLLNVKLLICELTYVEGPTDTAETFGHCHLHDFASAQSSLFSNVGQLFFVHFSRRHHPDRVLNAVHASLPDNLLSKVYCGLNGLRFYHS